jgi:hypothetical protein
LNDRLFGRFGAQAGFGDWQFLVKYSLAAANEEHGNYILTAFFPMSLPTGQYEQGALSAIITLTFAYGEGIRNFDVQGTFSISLPTGTRWPAGATSPGTTPFNIESSRKSGPKRNLTSLITIKALSRLAQWPDFVVRHAGNRAGQISSAGSPRAHRRHRVRDRRDIVPSHKSRSNSVRPLSGAVVCPAVLVTRRVNFWPPYRLYRIALTPAARVEFEPARLLFACAALLALNLEENLRCKSSQSAVCCSFSEARNGYYLSHSAAPWLYSVAWPRPKLSCQ